MSGGFVTTVAIASVLTVAPSATAAAAPCDAVINEMKRLDAGHVRLTSRFVIAGLGKRPGSAVHVRDTGVSEIHADDVPKRLAAAGLPPNLLADENNGQTEGVYLRKAGPLIMLETMAGTAECGKFRFFRRIGGKSRPMHDPPQIAPEKDRGGFDFCNYIEKGWLGTVAGAPAFFSETAEEGENHSLIRISTWKGEHWSHVCGFETSYVNVLKAQDQSCSLGKACAALPRKAELLARSWEKKPKIAQAWAKQASSSRARRMISLVKRGEMPDYTFSDGGSIEGTADAAAFPITLAGKTYLARLSSAGFAWRAYVGDLLVVYDLKGGRLAPVAGVYIARQRGRLRIESGPKLER